MVEKKQTINRRRRDKVTKAAAKAPAEKPYRYAPPSHWETINIASALLGTQRWNPQNPPQLSFLRDADAPKGDGTLYAAGDLTLVRKRCVSVIGTRKVSEDGARRARKIARSLAQYGIVIVSGLAEGVDTEAMTAAMDAPGHTIGVIGTPLNRAYPPSNAALQERVYRDHLLVSMFAIGEKTWPSSFVQRNRLMAVLSDATVIVEASDTSGTLHQAKECQRLGRWLFIMKSVADDRTLKWPASFLRQPKTAILENAEQVIEAIGP